jgi:hypothetical protein
MATKMSEAPTNVGATAKPRTDPPPRRKRRQNPETIIRKQVVKYLREQGWFVFHNLQGVGCFRGLSDLTAFKGGRTVWIEIKTPDGKQSREQWEFEQRVLDNGGEYVIARCVDDVRKLEEGAR